MSRAFVLAQSDKDLSSAECFGEIVFVLDYLPSPFSVNEIVSRIQKRLLELDFDPEEDCLVLTGPPDRLSMFIGTVTAMFEGPFKILIFDARQGEYTSRSYDPEPQHV